MSWKPQQSPLISANNSNNLPPMSFGDTLQLLALHHPTALKLVEQLARTLADPLRRKLAEDAAEAAKDHDIQER